MSLDENETIFLLIPLTNNFSVEKHPTDHFFDLVLFRNNKRKPSGLVRTLIGDIHRSDIFTTGCYRFLIGTWHSAVFYSIDVTIRSPVKRSMRTSADPTCSTRDARDRRRRGNVFERAIFGSQIWSLRIEDESMFQCQKAAEQSDGYLFAIGRSVKEGNRGRNE